MLMENGNEKLPILKVGENRIRVSDEGRRGCTESRGADLSEYQSWKMPMVPFTEKTFLSCAEHGRLISTIKETIHVLKSNSLRDGCRVQDSKLMQTPTLKLKRRLSNAEVVVRFL